MARCAAHLSTLLHTLVVSFSLLIFSLTCCATSSVVLAYYLFYSVLAMKWDYFHSLAVLRIQQFFHVEIPHTLTHPIEHSIDFLFRLQCATFTEPRCCWLWILQLPTHKNSISFLIPSQADINLIHRLHIRKKCSGRFLSFFYRPSCLVNHTNFHFLFFLHISEVCNWRILHENRWFITGIGYILCNRGHEGVTHHEFIDDLMFQ